MVSYMIIGMAIKASSGNASSTLYRAMEGTSRGVINVSTVSEAEAKAEEAKAEEAKAEEAKAEEAKAEEAEAEEAKAKEADMSLSSRTGCIA